MAGPVQRLVRKDELMKHAIVSILTLFAAWTNTPAGATEPATKPGRPLNVVVVTGGHGFDVKAFPKLFDGHPDLNVTHFAMKGYTEIFDEEHVKNWKYDVIVFYSMT